MQCSDALRREFNDKYEHVIKSYTPSALPHQEDQPSFLKRITPSPLPIPPLFRFRFPLNLVSFSDGVLMQCKLHFPIIDYISASSSLGPYFPLSCTCSLLDLIQEVSYTCAVSRSRFICRREIGPYHRKTREGD